MSDQEMSKKRKIYCTDDGNTNNEEENTSLEPHKIAEYEQAEMSDLLKYQLLLACFGEAIEKNRNVLISNDKISNIFERGIVAWNLITELIKVVFSYCIEMKK